MEIPNESPEFDPKWRENGHMQRAVQLVKQWVEKQDIQKSKLEVFSPPDRTPLLLLEVEGTASGDPILLYGHLDKQPAMTGWAAGLDPWKPVLRNGRLYGRGGDRKSTRLNSSHSQISYAVFCLKKNKYKHSSAPATH